MIEIRKAGERGYADHGWLKSYHTFSFADYYDPKHVQFGPLRVINEDRVAPGMGFGTHGHRDMEIISYVLEGELAHKDSMGNGSVIRPGDVQRMSAGTGVRHSEYNHAAHDTTHFLQIWILPEKSDLEPGYEEKHFPAADKRGRLRLVGSRDGAEGSVVIHQDMRLYAGLFDADESATLALAPGRKAYVHVARGRVTVNGKALEAGDAAQLEGAEAVTLAHGDGAEVLVFDLP
ncbi:MULTISPECIES: pirin family protein [Cupriavidus]|uniref:Pirin family protein n=1 Tax=Cupriavidus basilensis TaxID=68895 RepID=A0A643FM47_9BURK|nr:MULTISPECIES: pirin family protein [Cupriavidus]MBB1635409.1 quercetin 2,3-dioxygenase [Cupriavidus sp. UME77]MCP3023281.1 pirin family protein [Cupriavidus basilensis]QOT75452.1 pirin family protein [Cupriavidus basilensis]